MVVMLGVAFSACAPKHVRVYETAVGARGDVVQEAIDMLGKPYRIGGKGPDAFDCSGLIRYAYKRVGINLPPMTEKQIEAGLTVPAADVLPGDLVFFRIKGEFHGGIMLNKKEFVHSSKTKGVSVDSLESSYWRRSFFCFRTILEY